jgi:DNA-binding IclR family transcriptional regulator
VTTRAENPTQRSPRREQRELNSGGNLLVLIETLAQLPHAGISELARTLEMSKPSVDRLLVTLVAAGFAEQDGASKRYRLTPKIIALADSVRARTTVVDIARPHLDALAARLSETINLAALSGPSVVYLHTIPSNEIFRIEPRPGTMLPAYCTGLGKALLAHLPPERLDAVISGTKFEAHTPNTITSPQRLRDVLATIRRAGYALDEGEISEDLRCVAVAIRGHDGLALAAVSAIVPTSRFPQRRTELIDELTATAQAISDGAQMLLGGPQR